MICGMRMSTKALIYESLSYTVICTEECDHLRVNVKDKDTEPFILYSIHFTILRHNRESNNQKNCQEPIILIVNMITNLM